MLTYAQGDADSQVAQTELANKLTPSQLAKSQKSPNNGTHNARPRRSQNDLNRKDVKETM
jgi:hypothetical protein